MEDLIELKNEFKRKSMIFQYEEKMFFARILNINPNSFEKLSYSNWHKIKQIVKEEIITPSEREFIGDDNTLLKDIWKKWLDSHPDNFKQIKLKIQKILLLQFSMRNKNGENKYG